MNLSSGIRTAAAAFVPSSPPPSPPPPHTLLALAASMPWARLLLPVLLLYIVLCRTLRHRREKALREKLGFPDRASLARMTTVEAQQIIHFMSSWEMPLFQFLALQFGLFKTYGIESISRLLLATGNLTDPERSPKRFEDTAVLIGEFLVSPPTTERAMRGIARMNFLHSKYVAAGTITNADLLYTLSVFITEPPRFARLYDWRPLNAMERCAYGVFWKSIGDAMGIEYKGYLEHAPAWRDGLEFAEDIEAWAKSYEIQAMKPSTVCAKPARALIPMITYWVPWFAKGFVTEVVVALLDDRAREAFMLPVPGITAIATTYTLLVLRRFVVQHLTLPRFFEFKRQQEPDPQTGRATQRIQYGNYPFYMKPTFWNRWGPGAWVVRALGGKLPGDDPDVYMPEGYLVTDLGPKNRVGLGAEEMEVDVKKIKASRWGGCPF